MSIRLLRVFESIKIEIMAFLWPWVSFSSKMELAPNRNGHKISVRDHGQWSLAHRSRHKHICGMHSLQCIQIDVILVKLTKWKRALFVLFSFHSSKFLRWFGCCVRLRQSDEGEKNWKGKSESNESNKQIAGHGLFLCVKNKTQCQIGGTCAICWDVCWCPTMAASLNNKVQWIYIQM